MGVTSMMEIRRGLVAAEKELLVFLSITCRKMETREAGT
jgi:hypothetical protein